MNLDDEMLRKLAEQMKNELDKLMGKSDNLNFEVTEEKSSNKNKRDKEISTNDINELKMDLEKYKDVNDFIAAL